MDLTFLNSILSAEIMPYLFVRRVNDNQSKALLKKDRLDVLEQCADQDIIDYVIS